MKFSVLRELAGQFSQPTTIEEHLQVQQYLHSKGFDLSNFYQELEMSSRYVDTHQDITFSSKVVSLHSHTFCEILYCCSCQDVEYLVGTARYKLQPGDVVIVAPGVSHKPLLPDAMKEPYKRYILWLSQDFFDFLTAFFPAGEIRSMPQAALLRTAGTKWEHIGKMFLAGIMETECGLDDYEAAIIGNTISLLTHIKRAFLSQGTEHFKAEKPELLDQVLAYIEANLSRKIALETTAKHFYVSPSTITQTFHQKMGTSFYHCVTQRRLIAAKALISEGTNLESVSRAVGFSDYSCFYRAFKKEYGISPRQFSRLT